MSLNKGYVSTLVLLVLIFLSGIGCEVFTKVNSQERNVAHEAQKIKAVFLADSGLEWARSSLTRDPNWDGGSKLFRDGQVIVKVEKNEHGYRIITRAEAGTAIQKRSGVIVPNANGVLMLIHYEERYD